MSDSVGPVVLFIFGIIIASMGLLISLTSTNSENSSGAVTGQRQHTAQQVEQKRHEVNRILDDVERILDK